MNERIRQLAEQAGLVRKGDWAMPYFGVEE